MKMLEIDAVGMFDTTAEDAGKTFITTELGGGGTARPATVTIAKRGALNLLRHASILPCAPEPAPTRWLDMPSADCFTFAEDAGLIEPMLDLGAPVKAGDTVARIHPTTRTGLPPTELRAGFTGLLAARPFSRPHPARRLRRRRRRADMTTSGEPSRGSMRPTLTFRGEHRIHRVLQRPASCGRGERCMTLARVTHYTWDR